MFKRRYSQKPPDEFYASFKANWQAGAFVSGSQIPSTTNAPASAGGLTNISMTSRDYHEIEDAKDLDLTPKPHMEEWKFNPQFTDHNASTFTNMYNPFHGVFTPTPGGTALYHSQAAGDLHASNHGFGLNTPLSHPSSGSALLVQDPAEMHLNDHQLLALSPRHFQQNFGLFNPNHGFPPSHFSHQTPNFNVGNTSQQTPSVQQMAISMPPNESSTIYMNGSSFGFAMNQFAVHDSDEHFRFRVSLSAPTAMVKSPDEIPITYLNKGQAYSLSITDTAYRQNPTPSKYRTFVRISFEDEQQRVRPGACWQLWKEGRGTNEAHHRGGKLQAVEYVDTNQGGPTERPLGPKVETESFDGFSIIWHSNHADVAECSLAVRFNFLSTDFSHSKGVKGIPVRLCAKTEILHSSTPISPEAPLQELCYCKVKLFRDHGAERKLSNDVAHVKKTMEKLKQQIAQIEAGIKDVGKRKRSSSAAGFVNVRPTKVSKPKRSDSTSSESSSGMQLSPEEDMHMRLVGLQAMFTSTRPISTLFLQGESEDDPDLHPVSLPGPPAMSLNAVHDPGSKASNTLEASSILSPSPSQFSVASLERRDSSLKIPTPVQTLSRDHSDEWAPNTGPTPVETHKPSAQQHSHVSGQPVTIKRSPSQSGSQSNSIQVVHLDPTYEAPPERTSKPVACFYIKLTGEAKQPESPYYRAIYLMDRSLSTLTSCIAKKLDLNLRSITKIIWINKYNLSIIVDDEVVQELPEGQDMTVQCLERSLHEEYSNLTNAEGDDGRKQRDDRPNSEFQLVLKF